MQKSSSGNNSLGPSASQACAVCKYQRRKCTSNCPLAPFFPASNHKDFLNTRKLFGVKRVTNLIKDLQSQQKIIAMKTTIYEANVRAADPVGGCYRIILQLQNQINWHKAQLADVHQQLATYKAQATAAAAITQQPQMIQPVDDDNDAAQVHYGLEDDYKTYDTMPVHDPHGGGFQGNCDALLPVNNYVVDPNFVKVESEDKRDLVDVGDDIKSLLPIFHDKGEGAFPCDFKASVHCGSDKLVSKEEIESTQLEPKQHEPKHKLNNATSLFSLANGKQ